MLRGTRYHRTKALYQTILTTRERSPRSLPSPLRSFSLTPARPTDRIPSFPCYNLQLVYFSLLYAVA